MRFPDWLPVYGDANWRGPCPPETAEQVTFFAWLRVQYPHSYGKIAIHPRNEGQRTAMQTRRQKSEGMTTGASDIIIPGAPSFVCELKRRDHTKSRWQDGQLPYLEACQQSGSFVCVALGWESARVAFDHWRAQG